MEVLGQADGKGMAQFVFAAQCHGAPYGGQKDTELANVAPSSFLVSEKLTQRSKTSSFRF